MRVGSGIWPHEAFPSHLLTLASASAAIARALPLGVLGPVDWPP